MLFTGSRFFCLSIFSFIGLSFGDIHTAFDVRTTVPTTPGGSVPPGSSATPGGCEPAQVTKIEAAFTEAMEMVDLIKTAILSMQRGTEAPAVGWMFNALFGIQAIEDLNDRGLRRPQAQTDALAIMQNLMNKVEDHSNGAFRIPNQGPPQSASRNPRIFCSETWQIATERILDPVTRAASIPIYFLPQNVFPGITHWFDFEINFYTVPTPNLVNPALMVCGAANDAATSLDNNAITFCPQQFKIFTTSADYTQQPTLDAPNPDIIGAFKTVSASFLHEYTHLVGRDAFGTFGNPIPNINIFPEHYGFSLASQLPQSLGVTDAIRNADSYAVLGVALKLDQCDWRDGVCRSPAYWAAVRQQTLAAAQVLLGIATPAAGP